MMYSPFFCELNQLYIDAQEPDEERSHCAVALIIHHVKKEMCAYAKTGAKRPSLSITTPFASLPTYYAFNPPREVTIVFPDLEKARLALTKETPEIAWTVVDEHKTPGVCECHYYCYKYGIAAAWTWAQCETDLT